MCSSGTVVYIAQKAICRPSGETEDSCGANCGPEFKPPDSLRMDACGTPSPPLTTNPKSSLYPLDAPAVGDEDGDAGDGVGIRVGPLVAWLVVGDGLATTTGRSWRWLSWY